MKCGRSRRCVRHRWKVCGSAHSTLTADLSARELEILKLMATGLTNSDIADPLHLSKGTVQNYVSNILVKLDVTNSTQAAVIALKHGLVV